MSTRTNAARQLVELRDQIARLRAGEAEINAQIAAALLRGRTPTELRAARREVRDALEDAHLLLSAFEEAATRERTART